MGTLIPLECRSWFEVAMPLSYPLSSLSALLLVLNGCPPLPPWKPWDPTEFDDEHRSLLAVVLVGSSCLLSLNYPLNLKILVIPD